eukprot:g32122.t1
MVQLEEGAIVDLVLANELDQVTDLSVGEHFGNSNHNFLSFKIAMNLDKSGPNGKVVNWEVPEDWQEAVVVPLFMQGNRDNPGNYKPVVWGTDRHFCGRKRDSRMACCLPGASVQDVSEQAESNLKGEGEQPEVVVRIGTNDI